MVELDGDEPEIGEECGVVADDYRIKKGQKGFVYLGGDEGLAFIRPIGGGGDLLLVKTVTEPSGGAVDVKYVDSDGVVVGDAFTVKTLP